jgi:hypothetical protein
MVTIRTKVTLRRRGNLTKHIQKVSKALNGPKAVKVGFPAGKSPADVVQYAIYNHFGTAGSGKGFKTERGGGFGGPIPARPFISAAMFKGRAQIRMEMKQQAYDITVNGKRMELALFKLGNLGKDMIEAQIVAGMAPANSPTTIRLKGAGKRPLNDEGRMKQSLAWQIVGSS